MQLGHDEKNTLIHPGIALDDQHPKTGVVPVAMVSNFLRFGAPSKPVKNFYKARISGRVRLDSPKYIRYPLEYKGQHRPLTDNELQSLKAEMGAQFTSRSAICCLFINICSERRVQRLALPSSDGKEGNDEAETGVG
jgi:hypothetical protein